MKANTLNDIYFFGRMLYNEFLQNVHLGPKSNIILFVLKCSPLLIYFDKLQDPNNQS